MNRWQRRTFLVLLICCTPFKPGISQDVANAGKSAWHLAAEKNVAPLLEKKKLNALVIGVIDRDGKKHYLTFGEKPTNLAKLDETTIFEIGSITKTMTAFLLAEGVQRNELKLDDPVQKYLPEGMTLPRRGDKDITLEHLATHTAGLPRLPDALMSNLALDAKLRSNPYSQFNLEQLKKSLASAKPKASEKPKVDYSNLGAGLLGFALCQKYGKSYETLLQEKLFKVLEMKSSSLVVPDSERARFIDGFNREGKPADHWTFQDTSAGAGAVRSTAEDMLRYLEAAMGRTNKLQPAFDLVTASQYDMQPRGQIGLGWLIGTMNKNRFWWHNGGTGGFSSFAAFSRNPGVGVVVLSNRALPQDVDLVGMKILEALTTGK